MPLLARTLVADSLRQLLAATARADTTRVRLLRALAEELMATDVPQA